MLPTQRAQRLAAWPMSSGASHASQRAGNTQSRRIRSQWDIGSEGAGGRFYAAWCTEARWGGRERTMRNFLFGLLIGVLATYWYLTQADVLRGTVDDFWERASSPPAPHGMSDGRGRP